MTKMLRFLMTATFVLTCSVIEAGAQQNPAPPQTPAQTQPQQGWMIGPSMIGRSGIGTGLMGRGMMRPAERRAPCSCV